MAQAGAWPNAHFSGLARASSRLATNAAAPAVKAPRNTSMKKWLAVATTTNVTSRGYRRQAILAARRLTSSDIDSPMINAKQMCIDGTAAYVLTNAPAGVLSLHPAPPVTNCE